MTTAHAGVDRTLAPVAPWGTGGRASRVRLVFLPVLVAVAIATLLASSSSSTRRRASASSSPIVPEYDRVDDGDDGSGAGRGGSGMGRGDIIESVASAVRRSSRVIGGYANDDDGHGRRRRRRRRWRRRRRRRSFEEEGEGEDETEISRGDLSENVRNHERRTKRRPRRSHRRTSYMGVKGGRGLVVGGNIAPPDRFPYMVSLQLERVLTESEEEESSSSSSSSSGGGGGGGEKFSEVHDSHVCGGTLVAMDVVLTAGHCGYEMSNVVNAEDGRQVDFGTTKRQLFYGADVGAYNVSADSYADDHSSPGVEYDNLLFERLVMHPEYAGFYGVDDDVGATTHTAMQHDVMLVKLYGESSRPTVRLHNPNTTRARDLYMNRQPTSGEGLVVTGWGDTDPNSDPGEHDVPSSILRIATLGYVPNDVCDMSRGYSSIATTSISTSTTNDDDYNNNNNNNNDGGSLTSATLDYFSYEGSITDDMMCALGTNGQDACQGDSGGGLLRLGDEDDGSEDVQLGIVSWGLQCGDEDFPGVYARVGEHYDWIAKTVCELSDSPPAYFNCTSKPYPPGSPYDPVVDLTITIQFDDYRRETGWILESMPDFRNVVFRQFGTYRDVGTVDEYNSMSEVVSVHSGRFYMLSILDEFGDGFCCISGEGYFRVDSSTDANPVVDTTPGILWSSHSLRRVLYVLPPDATSPPNYVTISITLGNGADPGNVLFVAIESVKYEALMLYEIRPFVRTSDNLAGAGDAPIDSRVFRVPVFGPEFESQRYNVIVYDDNEGASSKASFEVYHGDASPSNLILAQAGFYGDKNNISRSFVLFRRQQEVTEKPPLGYIDMKGNASSKQNVSISFLMAVTILGNYFVRL